jgi:hypothetical protein
MRVMIKRRCSVVVVFKKKIYFTIMFITIPITNTNFCLLFICVMLVVNTARVCNSEEVLKYVNAITENLAVI